MLGAEMRVSLECCQRVESRDNSSKVVLWCWQQQGRPAGQGALGRALALALSQSRYAGGRAARRGGGEVSWADRIDRVDLSQQAMLSWEGRPDRTSATHTTGRAAGRLKCLQLTARRSRGKPARYAGATGRRCPADWLRGRGAGEIAPKQHLTSGVRI